MSLRKLLDTSTLSDVMRASDPALMARAQDYLALHGHFTFSSLTRYEIRRGLEARHAVSQLARFDAQCAQSEIISLTDEIIVLASAIYGRLQRRGERIGDADILIAATARIHDLALVTENPGTFLEFLNWKSSHGGEQ